MKYKILVVLLALISISLAFGITQVAQAHEDNKPKCFKDCDKKPHPTPTKIFCFVERNDSWNKDKIACPSVTPTVTEEPSITPTPTDIEVTPSVESTSTNDGTPPTFAGSSTDAPVCSDGNTIQLPANVHVIRQGTEATVNFFITQGNSANIYVRKTGQSDWNNPITSAPDVMPNGDNFVSYTFHNLDANQGYDFGVQQKQGCGGGQLVTAVVVDGASYKPVLFQFNYWEWSK